MADFTFTQFNTQNIRTGTDIILTTGRETAGQGAGTYIADAIANAALLAAHPLFVGRSSNGRHFRAMPEAGRIDILLAGAKADGIVDDSDAVRAAYDYARAIGADGVTFGRKAIRLEAMALPPEPLIEGPQPALVIPPEPGIHDFGGAQLFSSTVSRNIVYSPQYASPIIDIPLIADVVPGDTSVRVSASDAAQLQVGDLVLWQLGELPYDTPETLVWDYARVTSVAGEWVGLDKPIPEALILANVTGPNKRLRKLARLENCVIRDVTFNGPTVAESGVSISFGKRITIERVGGRNIGAGVVIGRYCDGFTAIDCWQDGTDLIQPSYGPAFNFSESRDVTLVRPQARGVKSMVRAEAGAEIQMLGGHFENTLTNSAGQSLGTSICVIEASGRGNVSIHDLTITGYGGYRLAEVNNGQAGYEGAVQITGTLRLRHPAMPFSIPVKSINGVLDMEIGGIREVHDFTRLRRWSRRFMLRDNEYLYAFGPPGILVRASFFTASGITIGAGNQLTGMWLGREGNNGSNMTVAPYGPLIPGSELSIPVFGGTVGGAQWTLRNSRLQLLCVTAANAGLDAACKFVEFEGWVTTRREQDYPVNESDWLAMSTSSDALESLFKAWDLPALAAGSTMSVDLPIPAMVSTDQIEAVRVTGGLNGLTLDSVEARAGLARLTLSNRTASAIDRTPTDMAVRFARERVGR
ncbi:hypothetical protein [Novosphingobium sp.]|uniref:hypothetical protein n=1 Tax=Novosphingobium sp. TaxID=1874826 RepID=UPI0027323B54|nr:hypothetical protein [Novosphingobium sp.]MDP3906642.1 hypothetical protein [Novosphingobium sp.]